MKKLVIRFNAPVVLLFALLSLLVLLLDGWTGGVSTPGSSVYTDRRWRIR